MKKNIVTKKLVIDAGNIIKHNSANFEAMCAIDSMDTRLRNSRDYDTYSGEKTKRSISPFLRDVGSVMNDTGGCGAMIADGGIN
jgi:hypothetical protein